jgi:hypothetical protein
MSARGRRVGTVFEHACAAASNAIDAAFGAEDFLYQPMGPSADPNDRPSPDANRAAVRIVPFLTSPYARAMSGTTAERSQGLKAEKPGHASARPVLDLALAQLPYLPRKGDRVRHISTGKIYRVAEVEPDLVGLRATLDLNEL